MRHLLSKVVTHELVDDANTVVLETLDSPALVEKVAEFKNLAVTADLNCLQLVKVLLERDLLEVHLA